MRERYERLNSMPGLLYTTGSPVIIEAGALLKDNQYNSAVAQLKFKNISNFVIKAVTVIIFALDTAQRPLGEPVIFQYLDLSAKRDDSFGQDIPVNLPDPATRAFYVSVREVIFENNEVWNSSENVWQPLPAAVPLNDFFKDSELTKQFKLQYGSDSSVCPVQIGDIWYCTCGKINHIDEFNCHNCKKNAQELFHVDLRALAREKEERLRKETYEKQVAEQKAAAERAKREAEENARRERIEKEREEAEKKEHAKKIKIFIVIVILLGAIFAIYTISSSNKDKKYHSAEELLSEGKYQEAILVFSELENYKDSSRRILEIYYNQGNEALENKEYADARAFYEKANDFSDAETLIKETYYREGIDYVEKGKYEKAIDLFKKNPRYKDAVSYVYYCILKQYKFTVDSDPSDYIEYLNYVTLSSLKKDLMQNNEYKILSLIDGCWLTGMYSGYLTALVINNGNITEKTFYKGTFENSKKYKLENRYKDFCYGNIPKDYWCVNSIDSKKMVFYHYSYSDIIFKNMKDQPEFWIAGSSDYEKYCK